jgi:KEOPS complex subunit Cgi121
MNLKNELDIINIVGAIGNINNVDKFIKKVNSFAKLNNVIIQVFDADMIYGKSHLLSSVEHALRAIKRESNRTKSLEMEILLYASGERQLKIAIQKMGIKKGKIKIVILILKNKYNKKGKINKNLIEKMFDILSIYRCDKIIDGNYTTLKNFGIDDNEIKTVSKLKYGDLILEKIAMVDVIK